uniref:Uncharacterized protein n=1 Tax=Plectus sambesii TaxID=2011161 RepID=A0A914UN75_9BILA
MSVKRAKSHSTANHFRPFGYTGRAGVVWVDAPLSSFDDSEDDCDRRRPHQPIAVALVHTPTLDILHFQSAHLRDSRINGGGGGLSSTWNTYQEVDVQTDQVAQEDIIETLDRAEQTAAIGLGVASTQVDAPELARHFGYRQDDVNLSTFERIMRHLSQKQHISGLRAWLQPETARTSVRFNLSPSSPYASKIILAAYDSNQVSKNELYTISSGRLLIKKVR